VLYRIAGVKTLWSEISYEFGFAWEPMGDKEQVIFVGLEVWSDSGWTKVLRLIRHRTTKNVLRVTTESGCVDVTSDHSLLTAGGQVVRPSQVRIGDTLLHADLPPAKQKLMDFASMPPKLAMAVTAHLLSGGTTGDKVVSIENLGSTPPGSYVYDLETESHRFSAGVGRLVVHNTDSIFVSFPGVKDLEKAFEALVLLCKAVTQSFSPSVIALQPEKAMFPLEMVGKKKYIFNQFEGGPKAKPKLSYKGVELARRDNCGLVIDCMSEVVDCLMLRNSPALAKEALNRTLREILVDKVDINKLVVSKNITKADYKVKPLHVIVSERMVARDPSYDLTGPGEKVPYVIVRRDGRVLADRAEDPLYAITHGYQIDSEYYVRNQLAGPMSRVFMFVDMDPGEKQWLKGMEKKIRDAEFLHQVSPEKIALMVKDRKSLIESLRKKKEQELFGPGALQRFTKKVTAGSRGIGAFFKPLKQTDDLEDVARLAATLKAKCDACRGMPSDELSCAARDCPVLLARAMAMQALKK
jgi:hypothetical protein